MSHRNSCVTLPQQHLQSSPKEFKTPFIKDRESRKAECYFTNFKSAYNHDRLIITDNHRAISQPRTGYNTPKINKWF